MPKQNKSRRISYVRTRGAPSKNNDDDANKKKNYIHPRFPEMQKYWKGGRNFYVSSPFLVYLNILLANFKLNI